MTVLGVADFGYDFYLLAIASLAVGIAKLLHGQYIRLLDFYFHTLIQQRPVLKLNQNLYAAVFRLLDTADYKY